GPEHPAGPPPTEGATDRPDALVARASRPNPATHRPGAATRPARTRESLRVRARVRQIVAGNPQGDVDVTSTETRQPWSERLNPRNWTLTVKLVVVGLVPALLALALGVLRVSDQAGAAAELGQSTQLLEVQEGVAATADVLRQERDEA